MMTSVEEKAFSLSYQGIGVAGMWVAAIALQVISTGIDHYWLGNWSIMLAGGAAAWTAVFGVKRVMCRVAECLVEVLAEQQDKRLDRAIGECSDNLMRRLELRELEQQVSRLVPTQRT